MKKTPIGVADQTSAALLSGLFGAKVRQIRTYSPSYLGDLELVALSDPADGQFVFDQVRLRVTCENHARLQ
jgi:hypothetical protein